jgi:predicted alpha/beta-hydrolase family hydrolase
VPAMAQIWLGHGAWGSPASMAPWIDGLQARGLDAAAVALPHGRAERGVLPFAEQVPDAPGMVVGGHSLGGRVATLLAAGVGGAPERRNAVAGVVALSFPLHPPRRPDPTLSRAAQWPSIAVPVLLLAGDADPFAEIGLLRAAAARLPQGELVVYRGLGHGLAPVRHDALERIAAFVRALGC